MKTYGGVDIFCTEFVEAPHKYLRSETQSSVREPAEMQQGA
jgi:hypothetical protein